MNVGEVMTRNVKTCSITSSLNEAARVMWENDCGAVPVVDDAGKLVAIITDRDICIAAYTRGRTLWRISVSDTVSNRLVAVRPEDSLHRAEQLMRDAQVRRLPVIDGEGRPIGILSITDLARLTPEFAGEMASHLVGTMVGICRPETKKGEPTTPSGAARSAA